MQTDAAVFRTGESLKQGMLRLTETFKSFADVRVTDRSLVWNTDLIETLELENLLLQTSATIPSEVTMEQIKFLRRKLCGFVRHRQELDGERLEQQFTWAAEPSAPIRI